MREKSVLITGATGFLGGYAVKEFASNGYRVIATGRNEKRGKTLESENVIFEKCALSETDKLTRLMENVTYVAHVAARSTVWGRWEDFEQDNVVATENVARAAISAGVKKLVYVSSPSIYSGNSHRLDIREHEFDRENDLNFYIRSKILSEERLHAVAKGKIEYNIIRPRGLVGAGDTSIIPRLIRVNGKTGVPLFGGGKNLVDMTSVENAAYALRLALEASDESGEVYNITNGDPREFRGILEQLFSDIGVKPRFLRLNFKLVYNIADMLERMYARKGEYEKEPALTRYTVCTLGYSQTLNIEKARRNIGYAPKVTLDETIKKYAESYNEHS